MITLLEYIKKSGNKHSYRTEIPMSVEKIGELANCFDAAGAEQMYDSDVDRLMDIVSSTGTPQYTFTRDFLILVVPNGKNQLCCFTVARKGNTITTINQAYYQTLGHSSLGYDSLYRKVDGNLSIAYDEMNKLFDKLK